MTEDDLGVENSAKVIVYLSPDLVVPSVPPENDLSAELEDELKTAGLLANVRVHDALAVRGAAHEIWLTLSTEGNLVLLGAAGAAIWQGVASAFGRLFAGRGGRCSFALRTEGKTAKTELNLSGSATEITEALRVLPDVLRATRDAD